MSWHRSSLATLLLLLAACGGGGSTSGSTGPSTAGFTVLLKDAPAKLGAAVVTISEVDLVGSSGTVVLSRTPTTTNLLDLANEAATLVKDAVVPPGTYTQLQFVITGGYVQVGDTVFASSSTYAGLPSGCTAGGKLQMPSYAQSGLKVDLPNGGLQLGSAQKIVVVDFDVSRSFGPQAGMSGMWVMHPVLQATDLVMTGTLAVSLGLGSAGEGPALTLPSGLDLTGFSAVLTPAAGDSVTLPLADDGTGTIGAGFKYLTPGDYTLSLIAPTTVASFATAPAAPVAVTISSGQVTTEALVLTDVVMAPGAVDVALSLASGVALPSGVALTDLQAVLTPLAPLGGTPATAAFAAAADAAAASFPSLPPGDYALTLELPAGLAAITSTPALPSSVTVTPLAITQSTIVIDSVTAPAPL